MIVLAQDAAIAAYHFLEKNCKSSQLKSGAEVLLKNKISDIVDTRKHGNLRNKKRTCTFSSSLRFEANEDGKF